MTRDSPVRWSRYAAISKNDIDFFVCPQDGASRDEVLHRLNHTTVDDSGALNLYIHTPFCAESCVFCAFAGANHKAMRRIPEYVDLVIQQMRHRFASNQSLARHPFNAIHFGGGSPDLLGPDIGKILSELQSLPGYQAGKTEISVEGSLATVKRDFVDVLVEHDVTKISFGMQTFAPDVAKAQKIVKGLPQLRRGLDLIAGRIPFVNIDLMTGLPGQTVKMVEKDIETLINEDGVNAITTYSTSYNNSPRLIADVLTGRLPAEPTSVEHILMRFHAISMLYQSGWIRRGTHTYVRGNIPQDKMALIKGNESVARRRDKDVLMAFGPSSITSLAGLRLRQTHDLAAWCNAVQTGIEPVDMSGCSLEQMPDLALWIFPLRYEGLDVGEYGELVQSSVITPQQECTLAELVDEGLVIKFRDRYQTSILGEVFMGCLMRDLRQPRIRHAVDSYVHAGELAGADMARGVGVASAGQGPVREELITLTKTRNCSPLPAPAAAAPRRTPTSAGG